MSARRFIPWRRHRRSSAASTWRPAGVKLCTPPVAFAHPLDGGRAAAVVGSVEGPPGRWVRMRRATGDSSARWCTTLQPSSRPTLAPLRSVPRHPIAMARFGLPGLLPASILAKRFATPEARGLLAGVAAHSHAPAVGAPFEGAFGMLLTTLAHEVGWPVIEGGSARLIDALVGELVRSGVRSPPDDGSGLSTNCPRRPPCSST